MMISNNSQLGLRFKDNTAKVKFLKLMEDYIVNDLGITQEAIKQIESAEFSALEKQLQEEKQESLKTILPLDNDRDIRIKIGARIGEMDMVEDNDSSYYLICESVFKAAELIRIHENFSGRTIKDIKIGKYTYLLGKHRMIRFVCAVGGILGFYYDDKNDIAFEWGVEMDNGQYFFNRKYGKEFSQVMQILTFVELGDIEVKLLEGGKNNGGKKGENKIHNSSNKTVYVVDSTWNTIIMRTDGFAVRGHFRLQPCGESMKDRRLIWIDAFEKHGYKRKPKAEIVR